MDLDFQLILTGLLVIDVIMVLAYKLVTRGAPPKKRPWIIEQAFSFFPVLLFVWILRSFVIEPYRIPSSSLEPTLLVGDLIVVNKFQYGLRSPVQNKTWVPYQLPKRGDIAVFRWPVDNSTYYIKRVVGLAGDRVEYKNRKLFVNGRAFEQKFISYDINSEYKAVNHQQETIGTVTHSIHIDHSHPEENFDVVVPEGHFFGIGDNRSYSADSRYWGFIPYENLIGQAFIIWMSWDSEHSRVRWGRIGQMIH